MVIRKPKDSDWQQFDAIAAAEGWRVPECERALFRSEWSDFVGVAYDDGCFGGMVTAVCHGQSGWIGNLIVPPERRGRGFGGQLFGWAMAQLDAAGARSIWLTASESGRPLYEKTGFKVVGTIERWRFDPAGKPLSIGQALNTESASLLTLDQNAWGERRKSLLDNLAGQSLELACNRSAAFLQMGKDLQVLGPWYSEDLCPRSNRTLLQQALAKADPAVEIVVDLVESSFMRLLLSAAMFEKIGQTDLMVYGDAGDVNLDMMI